ncbi:cytochrome c [Methylocystis sp. IM3]|uniref:c-type cytochrome n=1 Tax=unclassified Methylocystis TaxID=2625913 RepID=UPI0030FB3938
MSERLAFVVLLPIMVGGCDFSMTQQRKYTTYEPSSFWADGASARPLPEGVVDQNALAREAALAHPPEANAALLARGHERFGIFCAPCHGLAGDGDGIIVMRGFPAPPSFHSTALVAAPAQTFLDAIANGYGVMHSYSARVDPADRWAIVAYVRALQLSRLPASASLLQQGAK